MAAFFKKGSKKENTGLLMERMNKRMNIRGLEASKYCGMIALAGDALVLQKNTRNEQEYHFC
jgi:hypothetical protein